MKIKEICSGDCLEGFNMKKILLLLIVLLISFSISKAIPVISNLSVNPSSLWLGESATISLKCVDDNENNTIQRVYLNVSGPDVFISDWDMDILENNVYSLTIDNSYLYKTGDYLVNVYCKNNITEITPDKKSFKISQLTNEINQIIPEPSYLGDEIEINVFVRKDNIKLTSGVNFTITIGDYEKIFNQNPPPLYDGSKGWILRIDLPESTGVYDLLVKSQYDRTQATSKTQIEIKQPLQFDLVNIDKKWLKNDDNITLTFQASFKGESFSLSENNIKIWINDNECEILETSRVGSYSYVKIKIPNLSPGEYDLKIRLTYKDFIKELTEKVDYVVSISGEIINTDGKPVSTSIEFRNDKLTKKIVTDSNGHYLTEIPIGTYDVELKFPRSTVILSEVNINDFNDAIRYDESTSEVNEEGIGVGGIFVYEFALSFEDAYVEMKYDDSNIPDEDRIDVYRCDNWNFGKRVCNGEWNEVNTDIDSIRNYVKLNTTSLSTFLIGYKKQMIIDANVEKYQYYLNDIIKVLGIVEDEEQKPVEEAIIKGKISGTDIEFTTRADNGGVFAIEFQGPSEEGTHELIITAEKSSYAKVEQTVKFEAIKSKKLTLTVPSSLKIKQNENATTEFLVNNLGQTDFHDLKISVEGIPNYYTLFETEFNEIKAGIEKRIPVIFEIPKDAGVQSYTGKVKVKYNDSILEDEFILTILEAEKKTEDNNSSESSKLNLPSANIILPNFSFEAFLISIFSVVSIGGAIWFKKKKINPNEERVDIKNLLLDIKREIERNPDDIKKTKVKKTRKKGRKKSRSQISYAS